MPEAQSRPTSHEFADLERRLIERTLAGDEDAFRELVQAHYRVVLNAAYRALGSQSLAEDLTQEVFFKVFQNLRRYRFEQPFIHWVHRITSNAIVDAVRRRRPVLSLDGGLQVPAAVDDPQDVLVQREMGQRVAAAIARLPAAYRATLVLRVYQELSYAEIAQMLGIPQGTVMSRLHNAKEILRKSLRESLESPNEDEAEERTVNKS